MLRSLLRRVDKNLDYEVRAAADPDSVIVALHHGKLTQEVPLRLDVIRAASDSLANREALRMRIKRARDAMWASVKQVPLQSNRMERPAPSDSSYFLSRGNAGGQRRR
jgi:hypothetical protein